MLRKGLKPGFRIGVPITDRAGGYRRTWRFRRSRAAIAVLVVMDVIFGGIAIATFAQVSSEWAQINSLFDLVAALFLSAWLLGWSMAPLLMTGILLLMLFGREALIVQRDAIEITAGLPFIGLEATFDISKMRNLRLDDPPKNSGRSWRGKHAVFDYGANSFAFGSDVNGDELIEVRQAIRRESGVRIRRGDALPEEKGPDLDAKSEQPPVTAVTRDARAGLPPVSVASASTIALIVANLVPVAGTLFLGWKLSDVMVLYWAESAVIGLFNIARIIVIGRWTALFAAPFFAGHFGGFMAVHFLFIYTFFVQGPGNFSDGAGDLAEVAALFTSLWPALAALFISHGFSFSATSSAVANTAGVRSGTRCRSLTAGSSSCTWS